MKDTANTQAQEVAQSDIKRETYNLYSQVHQIFAIGSLQTLTNYLVVAGDTLDLKGEFVFRQSPLRRQMYMDLQVDIMVAYHPHRHFYANWVDFVKDGIDEGISLGSQTLGAGVSIECLGHGVPVAGTLPLWKLVPYIHFYKNYVKDPSDTTSYPDNYWTTVSPTDQQLNYGLPACHLQRMWNTTIPSTLTTADTRLPLDGGEVDLINLQSRKARLQTERERDYFALRYRDVVNHTWQSFVNVDQDQRPRLLARVSQWISGYDVDATDTASLGYFSGKSASVIKFRVPPVFIPEHGTIWVYALLRYPPIHRKEANFLQFKAEPTYKEIAGDPTVIANEGPYNVNLNEMFVDASSVLIGDIPYGQWYREQPSVVHKSFETVSGHPFLTDNFTSRTDAIYITHDMYDNIYQTLQLKHAQCHGSIWATKKSFIPDPRKSIYAGTR